MRNLKIIGLFLFLFFSMSGTNIAQILTPDQIPGLSLWLKADAGPLLNGSNVFQWNDYSGNSNNAVQSIVESQPILVSNALNGLPVVRFDGANDFITGGVIPNIDTSSISVFVVAYGASGASANLYGMFNINAYTNGFCLDRHGWNEILSLYNNGSIIPSPDGTLPNAGYNFKIFEAVKKYNIETELFINGISQASSSNSLLNGPFTNADYVIGYSQGWAYLNGDIAEILVFKQSLSAVDRQSVENYLRMKYARQIDLGPDIIAYGFQPLTLNAQSGFTNYLWNDGSTDSTLSIHSSGAYWVQANDAFGYVTSDTVHVAYPNTRLNYQNDTAICLGSDLLLRSLIPDKSNYTFLWSNGSTDTVINVSTGGSYWVKITDTL